MRTALSENHYCGPNCSFLLAPVVQKVDNAIHLDKSLSTILVKRFGTRCVSGEENVIEVELPPHPRPPPPHPLPPPEQCWVLQVKQLLHILYTLRTLTLFRGGWGWGKIFLRP